MHVLATAGHVDHGKSTLVRALTGMEPDRWSEERRRGMTIDLGYAWTTLPTGQTVAFVDVPGHERFIGNMLAGLGPVSAVMFVVAADEGWREQSAEHLLAVDALGLTAGLLVVTRSDLADPAPAVATALDHLSRSSLGSVPVVTVSGRTGNGLPELRAALGTLVDALPPPDPEARVRLWIDRSFTIRGSGTVVTGTLGAGTLAVGDELELLGRAPAQHRIRIRGLHTLGRPQPAVRPVSRVAVNVRSVAPEDLRRGDALVTPGGWQPTSAVEARVPEGVELPTEVMLHIGTASVPARVRPLGSGALRLVLGQRLALQPGDRALLQDQTTRRVLTGVTVLDVDPPALRRRGAAAARARELAGTDVPTGRTVVAREGAVPVADLTRRGLSVAPSEALAVGRWRVSTQQRDRWVTALRQACQEQQRKDPLRPGLPTAAAGRAIGLPDLDLLPFVVEAAGLTTTAGAVLQPGVRPDLGAAEAGLQQVESRLRAAPFDAPDRPMLAELRLGPRELSTAAALGRILRIDAEIVLLPDAPAVAMRALAALEQPFTTSAARAALRTTRRVAIPLLEHLDGRGWTRRVSGDQREVVRSRRS